MSMELKAQKGDTVSVHYIGKFPGGKIFDTSMEKEAKSAGLYNAARDYHPLMVILGTGKVIQGFDEALMGMKVNEEKEIVIPPEKAYGKTGSHPMAGRTFEFKLLGTKLRPPQSSFPPICSTITPPSEEPLPQYRHTYYPIHCLRPSLLVAP